MRSRLCPSCFLCGARGTPLYEGLQDRLFSARGHWRLLQCSNTGCGLIWLDPAPLPKDNIEAYCDYYTHSVGTGSRKGRLFALYHAAMLAYLSRTYGYFPGRTRLRENAAAWLIYLNPWLRSAVDFSIMWLPRVPGGRLLDVGCGSGSLLIRMQDLGWKVEGVDFDPAAAERAASHGVTVHLGDLRSHHFLSDTFDAVTMSHSIEHVHDPLAVAEDCHRILKRGGLFVVVTPNAGSMAHRLYKEAWMHLDPPRHLHLFNSVTLSRVVREAGFIDIRTWTSPRGACASIIASRSILRTGRHDVSARPPLAARIWGVTAELMERVLVRFDSSLGEELVLVARK